MSDPTTMQRREFVSTVSKAIPAFAIPTIVPAAVLGLEGNTAPNDTIQLGVIGFGRRAASMSWRRS